MMRFFCWDEKRVNFTSSVLGPAWESTLAIFIPLNDDWINQALYYSFNLCLKHCCVYSNSLKYLSLHSFIHPSIYFIYSHSCNIPFRSLYTSLVPISKKERNNKTEKFPFFRYVWAGVEWLYTYTYICVSVFVSVTRDLELLLCTKPCWLKFQNSPPIFHFSRVLLLLLFWLLTGACE